MESLSQSIPRPAHNGEAHLVGRPPVVVVMGHVDHGKTSLLDYIRKTTTAAREAGGITQSIGAYEIMHANSALPPEGSDNTNTPMQIGRRITFIDTPGHEAFIKMRATGAHVADLAILVVAAEEGVKPQTKEVAKVLHDTKTPFIVALTKIDKPEANVERAKQELANEGVLLEGYGGQITWHGISSKTGEGVNELLDLVLLTADLEHLTYDAATPASGFILESRMDSRRGLEAIGILTNGTLRTGDSIHTPSAKGKIKILEDFAKRRVDTLSPSAPCVIIGFESMPRAGETFTVGETAPRAEIKNAVPTTSELNKDSFRILLKADDSGSLEALSSVMRNLDVEKPISVIAESVGDVNDGDVKLAQTTGAVILGFKIKPNAVAKTLSQTRSVRIVASAVIYELVKFVENEIKGVHERATTGELHILAVFNNAKLEKQVVGGKVTKGVFKNKAQFDIVRAEQAIGQGRVQNLQQQKKDAPQVQEGSETGLLVSASVAILAGDKLVIKS